MIKLNKISKSFGLEKALTNVNLTVKTGEFLVLLGHSGSGKTTLLNCIAGLEKPDTGAITVDDTNVTLLKEKDLFAYRRNKIGYVFQSFNLLPELTALENVALFSDMETARKVLAEVELSEYENKYISQLSGGQQQRVSIARALSKKSQLILADEPTGALDYETGRNILKLLIKVAKQEGKTLILVTHTKEIGKLADHVVCLKNGRVEDEYYNSAPLTVDKINW